MNKIIKKIKDYFWVNITIIAIKLLSKLEKKSKEEVLFEALVRHIDRKESE